MCLHSIFFLWRNSKNYPRIITKYSKTLMTRTLIALLPWSRNKKNNVYPCKPQFYYIKVGLKGVKTIWVCCHDVVLSPYKIVLLAQENKYLGNFSYFIMKLYVVFSH